MEVTTTLNKIREHSPCRDGWEKLLKYLGKKTSDDEVFPMSVILESNNLDDCLWALRSRPDLSNLWRHFAVDCAEEVKTLMNDQRSHKALLVAREHASGNATDQELDAARAAARAAAWDAAWAAARAAARAAAWDAAWAAGDAARAAAWDAGAAWAAARAAAMAWVGQRLKELLDSGEWKPIKSKGMFKGYVAAEGGGEK